MRDSGFFRSVDREIDLQDQQNYCCNISTIHNIIDMKWKLFTDMSFHYCRNYFLRVLHLFVYSLKTNVFF